MQNQGKFECDRCGQRFNSQNEMQEHARNCTGAGKMQGQQQGGQKTRQAGGGGQTQDV